MPTYEYRCVYCGPFTRSRSIREETATSDCPDCGGAATRVFTIPPVLDRTSSGRRTRRAAEQARSTSASRGEASTSWAATQPARLLGEEASDIA